MPRSNAYARWGISYPLVAVDASCHEVLSAAVQQGGCCVYDVSVSGTPRTTLQRGTCPASVPPLLQWKEENSTCLPPVGRPKVIDDDC